ncbi:MAG: DUF3293 domain-containing protein [Candidatus Nanopelagicales bacterium]
MTDFIREDLWRDYVETRLLFSTSNTQYRLRADINGDNIWPWKSDIKEIFIISAIHPRSAQSTTEEIVELEKNMQERLNTLQLSYIRCIGKPAHENWPEEESYMIFSAKDEDIVSLCQAFDQNAYFHWTRDFWAIKGAFTSQATITNWILEKITQ